MTVTGPPGYDPPAFLRNAQIQTVLPALFRRVGGGRFERQRIATADGDFIDLDWSRIGSNCVAIVCHGLESSSQEAYMRGMIRAMNRRRWDAVALNFRGCSGEPNRLFRSYHSGETGDLAAVVEKIWESDEYRSVVLIGFSIGGNVVLKYLGEHGQSGALLPDGAAALSVPCDLKASADQMARTANGFYMRRFLRKMIRKVAHKSDLPGVSIDLEKLRRVADFKAFDDLYTAPAHGFRDAHDYWRQCSSRPYIPRIRVPTLLINARDDPFLAASCFPYAEAKANSCVEFEAPEYGGHVGFITLNRRGEYWHETRVVDFLTNPKI